MAEIYINKENLENIIKSYSNVNDTFFLKSFSGSNDKKRCDFFIGGKECKVDIFFKKNNKTNLVPIGKNIEESNLLINYISERGQNANISTKNFSVELNQDVWDALGDYITNEFEDRITKKVCGDNRFQLIGYDNDILTLTFFPSTGTVMIQGKPLQVYNIVVTYLSLTKDLSFEEIMNLNNAFNETTTTAELIRADIKTKIGNDVYNYLDEALLMCLSGSFSSLKQIKYSEDYSGSLTGVFKTLEGYLTKILIEKFKYQIDRYQKFSMFHKEATAPSRIMSNNNISQSCKEELNKLYKLYQNKRNVYLHATTDPSLTRIIGTSKEAQELADEILDGISNSYKIFNS